MKNLTADLVVVCNKSIIKVNRFYQSKSESPQYYLVKNEFDFRRNDYLSLDGHTRNKINENTCFMLVQVASSKFLH